MQEATNKSEPRIQLSEETIDELARGLVAIKDRIEAWFQDPKVQADYQKWLAEEERSKANAVQCTEKHDELAANGA